MSHTSIAIFELPSWLLWCVLSQFISDPYAGFKVLREGQCPGLFYFIYLFCFFVVLYRVKYFDCDHNQETTYSQEQVRGNEIQAACL